MGPAGNPEPGLLRAVPVLVEQGGVPAPGAAAAWHLRYRQGAADHVEAFASADAATEAACRLLDNGGEVLGIGAGAEGTAIGRERLALIYASWVRARYH